MTLQVLYVCTGNICRSPMAEAMMRARLDPSADVTVSSAGTHGLVGYGMDALAASVTREFGADPDGHEAQIASEKVVGAADLVLTATTSHRDDLLRLVPRGMRRTFTMREFVRLGSWLPPVPLRADGGGRDALVARIAEVAAQRGQVPPPDPGMDEIGDPFGGTEDQMRACGAMVSSAVDSTLHVLGLAPAR